MYLERVDTNHLFKAHMWKKEKQITEFMGSDRAVMCMQVLKVQDERSNGLAIWHQVLDIMVSKMKQDF